ncbi:MAG TPA: C25 family cysteine peptidase [bacterium]|nr:C25 family cysteine peptidase [bacterium]
MERMIMLLAALLLALPLTAVEPDKGLFIVTTDYIKNGSAVLGDLIAEKEKRGFTVRVVTESDYGGVGDKGAARAAKIRDWLVANRAGYDFVLLIGDPSPKLGDVPMVLGQPQGDGVSDPCADTGYSCVKIPTDLYYGDLSGSWDLNGDGVLAQLPVDMGDGGIDFGSELAVGRIPVYFGDLDELDELLGHIVGYMQTSEEATAYRKKMLFPLSFIWFDGYKVFQTMHENKETAETAEWFIHNILPDHPGVTYTRLYEAEGHYPTQFDYEIPLTQENLVSEWEKGYGMVLWGGHGMPTGVVRTVWREDTNGNEQGENDEVDSPPLIDSTNGADIASGKPSFVVAISCLVGFVSDPGSITYRFMADGAAVGVISSSSVTDPSAMKWLDQDAPLDATTFGEDNSAVLFFDRMLDGGYAGRVFADIRDELGDETVFRVIDHKLMLNYFGDPSLTLYDHAVVEEPNDDDTVTDDDPPVNDDAVPADDTSGGCSIVI